MNHTFLFLVPQFRYKTRVYKQTNLDEKALSKLSTKVFLLGSVEYFWCKVISTQTFLSILFFPSQASLKKFLDYIQTGAIEKMAKVLDKGLDSNFHDPDTGGETHSLFQTNDFTSGDMKYCESI